MGIRDTIKEKISLSRSSSTSRSSSRSASRSRSRSSSVSSNNHNNNFQPPRRADTVDAFGISNNDQSAMGNFSKHSVQRDAFGSSMPAKFRNEDQGQGDNGDAFGTIYEEGASNTLGGEETSHDSSFKRGFIGGDAFGASTYESEGPNVLGDCQISRKNSNQRRYNEQPTPLSRNDNIRRENQNIPVNRTERSFMNSIS